MRFKTHLMLGVFTYFILINYVKFENNVIALVLMLLFSILPDIDLHSSYLGKKIQGFSFIFEVLLGHRGIIHSLWVVLLLYFVVPLNYSITIIGYILHLFLDSFTKKGIAWIWPIGRIKGPCQTGKLTDNIIFYFLFSFSLFLILLKYYTF